MKFLGLHKQVVFPSVFIYAIRRRQDTKLNFCAISVLLLLLVFANVSLGRLINSKEIAINLKLWPKVFMDFVNRLFLAQIHNYPDESVYVKILPKHNHAALRERYQRFNNYSEFSMPEVTAMQKLQRLKELQMKRDISERYYSQEIKRLIGEYYFGPKIASPSLKQTGKLQSSSFHPSSADRLKNVSSRDKLLFVYKILNFYKCYIVAR